MAVDVVMPQMGESIFEGTITKWLKKPGDKVERDEPLFEISTDKVDAEIPAPAAGVLSEIKIAEGQTVPIQTVVAVIDAAGAARRPPRRHPQRSSLPRAAIARPKKALAGTSARSSGATGIRRGCSARRRPSDSQLALGAAAGAGEQHRSGHGARHRSRRAHQQEAIFWRLSRCRSLRPAGRRTQPAPAAAAARDLSRPRCRASASTSAVTRCSR